MECPDEHVIETIAVDVACGGDREARVVFALAADNKSLAAITAADGGKINAATEAASLAEDYIGVVGAVRISLEVTNSHHDVVYAIPVHVPCRGGREAGMITRPLAVNCEAVRARTCGDSSE